MGAFQVLYLVPTPEEHSHLFADQREGHPPPAAVSWCGTRTRFYVGGWYLTVIYFAFYCQLLHINDVMKLLDRHRWTRTLLTIGLRQGGRRVAASCYIITLCFISHFVVSFFSLTVPPDCVDRRNHPANGDLLNSF